MRENSRLKLIPALCWLAFILASPAASAVPLPPIIQCDSCPTGGPASYDLGNVPFSYNWPAQPSTTSSQTVTTMSQLQSAVNVDGNLITIPASFGTQSGNVTITGSDIEIVMSNSATINGAIQIGAGTNRATRIRWTGGNMTGGPLEINSADDVLINDFHATTDGEANAWTGGGGTGQGTRRLAVLNSTIRVVNVTNNAWAIYTSPTPNEDFIFANLKVVGSGQNNRLQNIRNLIIVDSILNPDGQSVNSFRTHDDCTNVYVRDTIIGPGGWLADPRHGALGIANGTFERVTKYSNLSAFLTDYEQTGTFNNGTLYSVNGTPGQEAGIGGFSGSNNRIVSWDGSSLHHDASQYGAVR